jgi:hypothetical protein
VTKEGEIFAVTLFVWGTNESAWERRQESSAAKAEWILYQLRHGLSPALTQTTGFNTGADAPDICFVLFSRPLTDGNRSSSD